MDDYVPQMEASVKIRNKKHYYDGLVGLGWFLPKLQMPIIRVDYLHAVRSQSIFCLKVSQVRLK